MEEKELWMNKLKEKLGDYSEPLPASGWEQLEKELMPPVERKIYPYRKWTVAAAAVILLALVSSVSLYFLGTPAADEIRHAKTPALASVPDVLPDAQQPDMTGTTVEPVVRPVVKNRIAKAERNIPQPTANIDEPVKKEEQQPSELNAQTGDRKEKEEVEPVEETKAAQHKPADTEQPRNKPRRPSSRDKLHIPAEKASSQKGTWSMGLSVGNSGGASTELGSGIPSYMSRVSMVSVSNGLLSIPNDQQLVFEDGVPYLRQANQVVDMEHHQPISFGLSVRKSLAKGFSVETGLTYTLLSSDAKFADSDQKTKQKLHYLGIPLKANWNFLDKKLFTLYVSGGGMIEKCVYGKLGTEKETVKPLQKANWNFIEKKLFYLYVAGGGMIEKCACGKLGTEKETGKPLQFSVSGAVGAQFNATKRVGIYVEPGVAYFFDDGSDVQTIRKENPFNFNIQAGIRLTY